MDTPYSEEFQNRLLLRVADLDDVKQEARIIKWQKGITPNRKLIQKRLSSQFTHLLFSDESDLPHSSRILWENEEDKPEEEPATRLRRWADEQPEPIPSLIREFLEHPEEQGESLPKIIRILRRKGLIAQPPVFRKSTARPQPVVGQLSGTLIHLLYEAIQQQPRTMEELYQLTSQVHQAKRPEAACRQAIRRLMRQNLIQKRLDGRYQVIS